MYKTYKVRGRVLALYLHVTFAEKKKKNLTYAWKKKLCLGID